MALTTCPECSKQISNKAITCPHCGYPLNVKTIEPDTQNNYINGTVNGFEVMEGYSINTQMVCPHCGKYGCVATKRLKAKKGISGAKATGALLTCGFSLLAVGLSRKEWVTNAKCKNCKSQWEY